MHRARHRVAKSWGAVASLAVTAAATAAVLLTPRAALAAPQAHILRIDPLAGVTNGAPELTTIVEIVQNNAMSDVLAPCNNLSGDAALDCQSTQMEKPGALWSAIKWPDGAAQLTVNVDGGANQATFESQAQWGASKKAGTNIGTAWLISLDASSGMGTRYEEARQIANEFISKMEANDLMDVMVFDDKSTIQHSGWQPYAKRATLQNILKAQASPAPSHGSDRALFTQIKTMINDAFGTLGNTGGPSDIPLHQAMVLLSDGSGRGDAESASPSADVFHQFLDGGRFPADNTLLPKTPLPVISLYFPGGSGIVNSAYKNNDQQFMQALANPEIGGYYDIVRGGLASAEAKGTSIISIVKKRFDEMYVVKWRLSCLALLPTQTFNLFFTNTKPAIAPDGSFKDVPIGVDPSQWPLDIDVAATQAEANKTPLYPGGTFKVYGNFCWDGDKSRAESYFVPAGTQPSPNAGSADLATARKAMASLQQQNMEGPATDASETSVTFTIPDDDKILNGTGDAAVAHLVVYDNKAKRSSGYDPKTILTLKAGKKPINWLLVAGIFGGVLVVGLIVITLLRSGGGGGGGGGKGKRRNNAAPPPQPVVAGGGYNPQGGGGYGGPQQGGYGGGAPPQGGGGYGPPGGGGYGASANVQNAPAVAAPVVAAASAPAVQRADAIAPVQVTCPSCNSLAMAIPGRSSICFTCGQPIPDVLGSTARPNVPAAPAYQPPPSPYAAPARQATITGKNGHFTIQPGAEVRVGRDPSLCPVILDDPRISGVHATLRFETPDLWARDETSNNGTWIQGARIAPNTWAKVPDRSQLRFGPVEFDVRLEA